MGLGLPPSLSEETRQGCTYCRLLGPLFAHLPRAAPERDRAGHRPWFYAQYASGLLRDFFHPVVTSWRGRPQTTLLATVQARLGGHPTSLRALSEAAYVFDAPLWPEGRSTRGAPRRPQRPLAAPAALAQVSAVDGRLLPALPRMAWALGQDAQPRAAKMPGAWAVLRQGPGDGTGTAGTGSERAAGRRLGQPGGFDVVARGSGAERLFPARHALPCRFLCPGQDNAAAEGPEARALAPAAVHAGGGRAALRRRVGTAPHTRLLPPPGRVGQVAPGKTRQEGTPDVVVRVTHRLDWDAEVSAVAYRSRWAVERFCRGGKGVWGCRHGLSQGIHGGRIQG
jgi:hypothetical protein